uniref:FCH and double SH3 domains 1 n=1 Tax=Anser cygnoides TaxID=8845 RepID=A0A8B9DIK5_ANSCY
KRDWQRGRGWGWGQGAGVDAVGTGPRADVPLPEHRAAAEGTGRAAGDGEGAGQGEEAVHPPPAQQRGGQGQGSRRGGTVRRGWGLQREWWGHAGGHTVPVIPRLRKSDRRIFHTKASLQKLSAKVGSAGTLAEYSRQLAGVQNEYVLTLVSANAHLDHYYLAVLGAGSLGMGLGCPPPHCGHLIP